MIIKAAIKRISDGKVWAGHRHLDCFEGVFIEEGDLTGLIRGFVTDTGEFLDRKEAFKHAVICNQIEDPKDGKERALISDDLY